MVYSFTNKIDNMFNIYFLVELNIVRVMFPYKNIYNFCFYGKEKEEFRFMIWMFMYG